MQESKVLKLNNKSKDFYKYMGKFFGSRVVQSKIKDRIYDDANKEWYVFLEEEKPVAFVSMVKSTIKNLYSIRDDQLEELLTEISSSKTISESVVPRIYIDAYKKAKLEIFDDESYKNFVVIASGEGRK